MCSPELFLSSLIGNMCNDKDISCIVAGGCPTGPDRWAKDYSETFCVDYIEYPADWNTHGRAAGPIRNKQMAEYADELLLIWDWKSRGSANMKKEMEKLGKKVVEIIIKV